MVEVNFSQAVRNAIQECGAEVGKENTQKIKEWVAKHYPAFRDKVNSNTFQTTLSSARKKISEASESRLVAAAAHTKAEEAEPSQPVVIAAPVAAAEPTPDLTKIVKSVQTLKSLAEQVGGKDNLRKLLEII